MTTSAAGGLCATRVGLFACAATPSSAPTAAPSAADPSLWNPRCLHVLTFRHYYLGTWMCDTGSHQELSHKGRYWHEDCFRCAKCYKSLAKEPFTTKDERILCGKCCSREEAPRCHACYKPILAGKNPYTNR